MIFTRYIYFFLWIFIASCSPISSPEIMSIENIKINDQNSEKFFLRSSIEIFNPNKFTISSKDVSYNLYLDSIYIGNGLFKDGLVLEKKKKSLVQTSLTINKEVLKSITGIKDSVSLKILGSTSLPLIPKKYYFDFNYKIYPKELISFFTETFLKEIDIKVKDVKIKNLDIKSTSLEITFLLENKTKFECKIQSMNVELHKTNEYNNLLGNVDLKNDFMIYSNSSEKFTSNLNVNTLKMGTTFFTNTLKSKNSFFIKLNSVIEYNNIEIPLVAKRRVDYNPITLEIELK